MSNAKLQLPLKWDAPLEAHSLWHKYKTAVWERDTPETATIHNTMRVLRSIRNTGPLAYISVPITSGQKYYEMLRANPQMGKKELMEAVMRLNYQIGWEQVEKVQERRKCSVLYPADLIPARQKWQQEEFQALWLNIIAEMCTEVHMCRGWNLSNGGIEELVHTFQLQLGVPKTTGNIIFFNTKGNEKEERDRMRRIAIFDHEGRPITIDDAVREIEKAINWLRNNRFSTEHHTNCYAILLWTQDMVKKGFYQ